MLKGAQSGTELIAPVIEPSGTFSPTAFGSLLDSPRNAENWANLVHCLAVGLGNCWGTESQAL